VSLHPPARRRSGGSVSGTASNIATSTTAPNTARNTNTPRQLVNRSSCPPSTGATIGATPLTSINAAK
jgi:hypothetical protein